MGNYLNYSFPMGDRSRAAARHGTKRDGSDRVGNRGDGEEEEKEKEVAEGEHGAAKEDHLIKSR